MKCLPFYPLLLCVTFLLPYANAGEVSEEALERWFESDETGPPQKDYSGSEKLEFIAPLEDKPTPLSKTLLAVTEQSMETGWVGVSQCYENLDPVADAEVVYHFALMRGLRVTGHHGIGGVRVEGPSIQLRDAHRGAGLCVELEAKLLRRGQQGEYLLRYGPFMRKFLDSYFPMHVMITVNYPEHRLVLDDVTPLPDGPVVKSSTPGSHAIDVWFRGRLTFNFLFQSKGDD